MCVCMRVCACVRARVCVCKLDTTHTHVVNIHVSCTRGARTTSDPPSHDHVYTSCAGKLERAIDRLSESLALRPRDTTALARRAKAFWKLNKVRNGLHMRCVGSFHPLLRSQCSCCPSLVWPPVPPHSVYCVHSRCRSLACAYYFPALCFPSSAYHT